jgi:hypothetical protein
LDALNTRKKEIFRCGEIAARVLSALESRLAVDREADSAKKKQADYDAALDLQKETEREVKRGLDHITGLARRLLRRAAESDLKAAEANRNLPPGMPPILTIDPCLSGCLT